MKTAIFMVTKRCNQSCKFCLNKFDGNELEFEDKLKVLDELKENNFKNLVISGGEPFVYERLIELIDYAYYKCNFKILIQTNGTLLNRNILEKLKGKIILEVSLEGLEKEHNLLSGKLNFRKIIKNIKLANELGINVFTNFTITKTNLEILEDYIKLLEKLNVKVANFTKLYLSGRALENLSLLPTEDDYEIFLKKLSKIDSKVILHVQAGFREEILRKYNIENYSLCSIGKEVTITPEGKIKLCPAFPKNFGDVFTDLKYVKDIKPSEECLVNSLVEVKQCIN